MFLLLVKYLSKKNALLCCIKNHKNKPMRKFMLVLSTALALFTSCKNGNNEEQTTTVDESLQFFGDTITQDGAIPADQLISKIQGKDTLDVKLIGVIADVCQKKGCWMNLNIGNNQTIKVKFKDYSFFVPKDAAGKTTVIEGVAFTDTIAVSDLRHYAEDAGKSTEEIEKINQP